LKIGLLDIDGHNFPNLALMKLSAWHKQHGDKVEFASSLFGDYDILYRSKVFTFTPDDQNYYKADKEVKGGTGYDVTIKLPEEIENICPDYSLYDCDSAYGFLTRGCIRKCEWCLVPEKEGKIRPVADIQDFISDKKSAVLMDNNVLALEHGIKQIEKIVEMKIKVDFNQGLDARLIDDSMAKLLSQVKWLKPLRMACDSESMKKPIEKAVNLLRKYNCTPKNYFVYTLINDIDESIDRIMFLKSLKVDPFGQPFRDFKNNIEPTREQKQVARWVNHKAIFKTVEFKDYRSATGRCTKSLSGYCI
jgi:hypothetical protein